MLTGTGGNSGAQSSVIVIRSMVLGEIQFRDLASNLKEFRIGILAGLALSAVNFLRIYLSYGHNFALALTVSLALVMIVILPRSAVLSCQFWPKGGTRPGNHGLANDHHYCRCVGSNYLLQHCYGSIEYLRIYPERLNRIALSFPASG